MSGDASPLTTKDLQSGRWLLRYARKVFLSTDAVLFVCSGIAVGLVSEYFKQVESDGEAMLLALTAIGFAALAVALTALSIFVSLVNDAYLRVLDREKRGGIVGYIFPYLTAALISSIATTVGAVGALVYKAIPEDWVKAVILGLEVGLVVWVAWAVYQIVVDVASHGLNRYNMAQAVQDTRDQDIEDIIRKASEEHPKDKPQ